MSKCSEAMRDVDPYVKLLVVQQAGHAVIERKWAKAGCVSEGL
jgi:hypothetical protein